MANRRRDLRKEAHGRRHIDEQARWGVSIRQYCRIHGLSEPSFHAWKRELKRRSHENDSVGTHNTLVPVTVIPDDHEVVKRSPTQAYTTPPEASTLASTTPATEAAHTGRPLLEVQVDRVVIRLREDVSEDVLGRVIAAAARVCRTQEDDGCGGLLHTAEGGSSC